MKLLNLGILAHVDAGKTSLTERLLYAAGVIDEIGSVDDGSTQTDSLALERQRGITIKSAVVSFPIGDVTVNLIDTPGHPDFIAEVERALSVLDGAVLVISAVEGVQAQTRVLMRTLRRLRIPALIFVNKTDRPGAQYEPLLKSIADKLSAAIVPMGSAGGLGTRSATFTPYGPDDPYGDLLEVLAENDEQLLATFVENEHALEYDGLRRRLAVQTKQALVHPVYFGSAITGAGTDALTEGIREFLPSAPTDVDGPVDGSVFKVERGAAGEKVAYVRMFSGTAHVRDRLRFGDGGEAKLTALEVFGAPRTTDAVRAGQIGKLWGLADVQIGDRISSTEEEPSTRTGGFFAPPTLETVISPVRPSDKGNLRVALIQLAEQDPLINLRQDDLRQETYVSLYGEVQKEVIQTTLATEFGIGVDFRETTTICVERIDGPGQAVEFNKKDPNPFLATVGLRVEPAPVNAGVTFELEVELGSMPYAFIKAVEETVRATLGQGIHGWQIPDARVVMTHSGYSARQSHAHAVFDKSMSSTAGDFRLLTPLVLMTALRRAGTTVHEPMHRFRLEIPTDTTRAVLAALARLRAIPQVPAPAAQTSSLEGEIPAAAVYQLEQQLPALTRGEGVLESAFERYQPVTGPIPERPRTDHDPLHRREYLLRVQRRV
ncbi:TetM/TetW/TetO/TetS family tetracycline resistance ribosomal protection protein [Kribbella turkmenica]|uniref:TetM/TetW/TetO/TetS family tetracycline resistance ribosomal protection protein n=1 Tax=Kribbella turkmenica TaxID=2530375 RepID=A0A4R4XG74_9ACTN|nr:TetM/TetW/TetO/TetS family tetracycline resistance ribosomal protection protein [Kribbella turkmenica]TDD29579.1 TetM/TetW/TetO/TetS family tetracycline resistance ribosomal protection protein [Kribbella turkmenica]